MSQLFVANLTRQPHDFQYRVPGEEERMRQSVQTQTIPPGQQMRIHNEAPLAVLEAIIDQHRAYGLVPVEEVVKFKGFVGLCYAFDKPVDVDRMSYAVDHNQGVLQERGVEQREAAAVAVDQILGQQAEEQHLPQLRGVSIETAEDSDAPKFAQGVRVSHDEAVARQGRRGRKG